MHWRHSRKLRNILLLGLSFLVLLAIVPRFVPLNSVARKMETMVKKNTGRTLTISGPVRFVLLPRPALLLGPTSLSERDSPAVFARVKRIYIGLSIASLFRGEPAMQELELESPELHVVHHEDGSSNFDDLLQQKTSSNMHVALQRIAIYSASFRLADEFLGGAAQLQKFDLVLSDLNDARNGQLQLQGELLIDAGRPTPEWRGKLSGQAAMRYDEKEHRLRIADLGITLTQEGKSSERAQVRDVVARAEGSLVYDAQPFRLTGGDLKLNAVGGRANQQWQSEIHLPSIGITAGALVLNRPMLHATMQSTRGTTLAVHAEVPRLLGSVSNKHLVADNALLAFVIHSPEQSLQLNFSSPVDLSMSSGVRMTQYRLTGSYGNQALPRGSLPFSLQGAGEINPAQEKIMLASSGLLDGAPFRSQITLNDFVQPHVALDFDIDRLNLSNYLPAVEANAPDVDPDQKFDFAWLEGVEAEGHVRIGELILRRLHCNDIVMQMQAKDRKLLLDPLEASVYGGKLTGRAEIDSSQEGGRRPVFRVQHKLAGVNIKALLADTLGSDRVEGRGYVDLDVSAVGDRLADLRRTAGGSVRLFVNGGALRGIDLEALQPKKDIRSPLPQNEVRLSRQQEQTRFKSLQANFVVRHGVATNNDLFLRTDLMQMTGQGNVNLGTGVIDYRLHPSTIAPGHSVFSGLALPILISGTLVSPEYKLDYSQLKEQLLLRLPASPAASARSPSAWNR